MDVGRVSRDVISDLYYPNYIPKSPRYSCWLYTNYITYEQMIYNIFPLSV